MASVAGLAAEVALRALVAPGVLAARWLGATHTAAGEAVPAAERSLARLTKAALDEIFFVTEVLSATLVAAADRCHLVTEVREALALYEAKGWLDAPHGYHRAPPPLLSASQRPCRSLGTRYRHLTFASGYEPHPGEPGRERWLGYEANRTGHAWVLEHTGAPRPWLICLHGYRTGHPLTAFVQFPPAWLHQRLGLNVLVPVLPLHGPRTVGRRSGEGFASGAFLDIIHLQAQAVWDVRRLLGWVRRREAPAVGLYGVSLGGATAALLAGLEPGLACVIAAMPAHDLVGLARRHLPAFLLALAARFGVAWDAVERLVRVISPLALAPHVAHERRFLFGGVADRLVPPSHVSALWHHWGRPHLGWHQGSHVSFSFESTARTLVEDALVRSGLVVSRPAS